MVSIRRKAFLATHYKNLDRGRKKRDSIQLRRERVLVISALNRLGLRYWQFIEINNPLYTNRRGEVIGGQQWIDFIVSGKDRKLYAIEFYPKWGRHNPHKYQLDWMEQKKSFLLRRGIKTLVLGRGESEMNYRGRIYIFLHTAHGSG